MLNNGCHSTLERAEEDWLILRDYSNGEMLLKTWPGVIIP